jgi:cytoskeletal protein CcmA (bactofilin family)
MSLTPLILNSNNAPEPAQNNTISLREYAGGPMAQPDMEQNLVNLKGRINALISNLDSLNTTVNGNQTSLQTEVSELSTSLTDQINQINAQLSGSGNIDATTLDVSGAVTTGELTVDQTLKIKAGDGEAIFFANDDYEALTIKPRSGSDQGSIFLQKSDLEVGGDAQIEGDLIVQGKVQGNLEVSGSISGASFTGLNDNIASFISPSICTNGFTNSEGVAGALRFWHDNEWMNPYFNGLSINPLTKEVYERYYWHRNFGKEAFYSRSNNTFYNPHGYSSPSAVMWDNSTPPTFSPNSAPSGLVKI